MLDNSVERVGRDEERCNADRRRHRSPPTEVARSADQPRGTGGGKQGCADAAGVRKPHLPPAHASVLSVRQVQWKTGVGVSTRVGGSSPTRGLIA